MSDTFLNPEEEPGAAQPGVAVFAHDRDSKVADANMPAGVFVVQSATGKHNAKQTASATDVLNTRGVAELQEMVEPASDGSDITAGCPFTIIRTGECWVKIDGDVVADGPVFVRHTANGAGKDVLGAVRGDADTSTAEELKTARVQRAAVAADGMALIRFNTPATA